MRCLFVLLIACLGPYPALAEQARLLSGEHADFSRLVLVFDRSTEWQAGRTSDGYRVALVREDITVDLSRVFDRIPKERILDVAFDPETGFLDIATTCTCRLEVFNLNSNTLVIDLLTGAPSVDSRFESRVDQTETARNDLLPEAAPKREPVERKTPLPPPTTFTAQVNPRFVSPDFPRPSASTTALEQAMIAALSRASTQGVIDLVLPKEQKETLEKVTQNLSLDALPNLSDSRQASSNITSSTVFDRALPSESSEILTPSGAACLSDEMVNLGEWAEGEPHEVLSKSRTILLQARDQITDEVWTEAARTLLFLGFGAEARMHLDQREGSNRESVVLLALADIVDRSVADETSPFNDMASCPNTAAIWAILSSNTPLSKEQIDGTSVQRNFGQLPHHLRQHLGADLAEKVRQAGLLEVAQAIVDRMERSAQPNEVALKKLEAKTQIAEGNLESGAQLLDQLSQEKTEDAPEAMILLLKARSDNQEAVPQDTMVLAEALAFELKGSHSGDQLFHELARAHANRNEFQQAFELAAKSSETPDHPALINEITQHLTNHGSDIAFLTRSFGTDLLPNMALGNQTRLDVAQRLLDLGFPNKALEAIEPVEPDAQPAVALIRSKIALAVGDPQTALRVIAGRNDDDAQRLRGMAMVRLNRPEDAATSFAAISDTVAAQSAALRSRDNGLIQSLGNPTQRTLVETLAPQQQADLAADSRLLISQRAGRALMERSASFREAARTVLNEKPFLNQ
jgi:hypothetical protein